MANSKTGSLCVADIRSAFVRKIGGIDNLLFERIVRSEFKEARYTLSNCAENVPYSDKMLQVFITKNNDGWLYRTVEQNNPHTLQCVDLFDVLEWLTLDLDSFSDITKHDIVIQIYSFKSAKVPVGGIAQPEKIGEDKPPKPVTIGDLIREQLAYKTN